MGDLARARRRWLALRNEIARKDGLNRIHYNSGMEKRTCIRSDGGSEVNPEVKPEVNPEVNRM